MGEVMSQEEIDRLLNALSNGDFDPEQMEDPNEKQVKNYDFKRPAKFSKEHLRTLENIFEHYSRLLSTNLPVYLRKTVEVSVANSETFTFSEFTNALGTPSILGIVDFQPLNGTMILELSPNLGFAMIDRMLGGQGEPLARNREFSEIEMSILNKLMTICMQLLREPWKNVVSIEPIMQRIETNPQFAQVISPSDMIAIVTLNVKIGEVDGFMNICLPFFTVEPIMDRLNTKFWFSNLRESNDENYNDYLEAMLKRVQVPVKAVLGNSIITTDDFLGLQVGDIIRLDTGVTSELNVFLGNIKKFTALPGTSKDNYAVQVTSVIREEK